MNPYMARNRHLIVHGSGNRRPLIWVQPGLHQAELIEKLGPEQPVYCIARPYLDRTKTPLTFDEITSFHLETVRTLLPEGPYALAGSWGHAAIAFEIASRLLLEGESISALILVDPADPATSQTPGIHEPALFRVRLAFDRIVYHLRKINEQGMKDELAHWRKKINAKRARPTPKPTDRLPSRSKTEPLSTSDTSGAAALPKFRNVAHADTYAFNRHIMHPCTGSATLLRPAKAPKRGYEYPNLRWKALFTNGLEIEKVPGDGSSMWIGENASALAQRIQSICQEGADAVALSMDGAVRAHDRNS